MKARKYLKVLPVAMLVLALGACDNDNDDLVGNWKSRSDFDGYARNSAASFVLDGKGYVCGGYKSTKPYRLGDLWEYNPTTNSWEQRADCPGALRNSAVGFAAAGKGYYGTGYNEDDEYLKDFWEYDPVTNTWSQLEAEFLGFRAVAPETAQGAALGIDGGADAGPVVHGVALDIVNMPFGVCIFHLRSSFCGC